MFKNKKVAVDVDGVLFPFWDEFLKWHNQRYGTRVTKTDLTGYDLSGPLGTSHSTIFDRVQEFIRWTYNQDITPIEMANIGVNMVRRHFCNATIVVTSREEEHEEATKSWLSKHFRGVFDDVVFTRYPRLNGKDRDKSALCQELGVDLLIDDHLYQVESCANLGIRAVLFGDYPWNDVENLPEGVVRGNDWGKVIYSFAHTLR